MKDEKLMKEEEQRTVLLYVFYQGSLEDVLGLGWRSLTFCAPHQRAQNLSCSRSDELVFLPEVHPFMFFRGSQEVGLLCGEVSEHCADPSSSKHVEHPFLLSLKWISILRKAAARHRGDEMSWIVSAEGPPDVDVPPTSGQTKAEKITTLNLSPGCCLLFIESNVCRISRQKGSSYETFSALTL